jgi:hypothetical protein
MVEYGTTTEYGSTTDLDSVQTATHSAQLVNLTPNTTYHYRVRSTDQWGNTAASDDFVLTTASAPTCPCSVWGATEAPPGTAFNDDKPIEVGFRFTADTNGFISGLRFYKDARNTGSHIGDLWSDDGMLLASATFANETAAGWQRVKFLRPVPIQAGKSYVAATYSANGGYSASPDTFTVGSVDTPPLHALSNGPAGGNGLYAYGSGFPTQSFNGTNYWVDVLFTLDGSLPDLAASRPAAVTGALQVGEQVAWSNAVGPRASGTPIQAQRYSTLNDLHEDSAPRQFFCPGARAESRQVAARAALASPPLAAAPELDLAPLSWPIPAPTPRLPWAEPFGNLPGWARLPLTSVRPKRARPS